ncbi:MAG: Sua5/YciO/YrdC/YwlC family protein, partial [Candidatus Hydrogenedentes bacterium]|nr:Sua5/YciO/YrdC/YwlC family protein [Candidatus Hydrogenedentota bacterium]
RADLPDQLTGGRPTVAVRCPGLETARELCRAFGGPLTSTSANLSGKPPAQSADGIELDGVDLVLDGGRLPDALPSTVFDPNQNIIYREGALTKAMLDEVPLP